MFLPQTAMQSYHMLALNIPYRGRWRGTLNAKKQARLVKSRQIDLTSIDDADMKPRIKGEWDQLPTVDIATMNRFPCIDFNHILDSTEVNRREEVIMDLLTE